MGSPLTLFPLIDAPLSPSPYNGLATQSTSTLPPMDLPFIKDLHLHWTHTSSSNRLATYSMAFHLLHGFPPLMITTHCIPSSTGLATHCTSSSSNTLSLHSLLLSNPTNLFYICMYCYLSSINALCTILMIITLYTPLPWQP